ncbi:putative retrotransposon gag domain, aspartic peptidase domain protein [Tanacetum coccineum]
MVGVKTSISELRERVEESHQHLEELGSDFTELREDFKSALNILGGNLGREIHNLRGMLMGEITRMQSEVVEEWRSLRRELEDLRADVSLCKRFMASGGGNTSNIAPKVEIPKPSPFMGRREARVVDDFLWEMEQYMEGVNIVDDASKIKTATRYLKDTMTLWWRRRYEDIKRDLSDQDSLFYFLDGLQGWAKTELERRGVQDLAMAIAHAEALINIGEWRSCKPTNEDSGDEQGGGEKQVKDWMMEHEDRPEKKKQGPYEEEEEDVHIGLLRVLNAINARKESPVAEAENKVRMELPKIEAKSNKSKRAPKISTRALVNTGATHNFISVDEAKILGLETMKDIGWIKVVNGDAKLISCVAQGVKTKIGEWEGELDLSVVPMDDYKLVLGMEFFDKNSMDGSRRSWKPLEVVGSLGRPWKLLESLDASYYGRV